MFNIGKVMSSFTNVQSGMFAGIVKQAVPSIGQAMNTPALLDGLSKLLNGAPGPAGGPAQQIAQSIAAGAGKSGLGAAASLDALPAALTKAMYISILLEAVEDAREKQHFNVETAINDLWVKLSKVRPATNQQMTKVLQQVTELLKRHHDMSKSIIGNMR